MFDTAAELAAALLPCSSRAGISLLTDGGSSNSNVALFACFSLHAVWVLYTVLHGSLGLTCKFDAWHDH
jgi:hypothetical protein